MDVRARSLLLFWPFHDGLKMDAEAPAASSVFQAEKKQKGSAAYVGKQSFLRYPWPTSFGLELCPQPC